MRRVVLTLLGLAAMLALTASMASGASSARCGVLYKPACTSPKVAVGPISVACRSAGRRVAVPKITVSSNSGIRRITIALGRTTIKSYKFKGSGKASFTVRGVAIRTAGLSPGIHTVTVTITDIRGKKTSKSFRFSICRPTPIFTG